MISAIILHHDRETLHPFTPASVGMFAGLVCGGARLGK